MGDFSAEHGPEARATIARLSERRCVFQGEGIAVSTGLDGPTACVIAEGGTLVDMLDGGDVDETDWRRSTTVRRFATIAARDQYLVDQPWQIEVRRRGWAVRDDRNRQTSENGAIDLRLYAGMSDSEVTVRADVKEDGGSARVAIRLRDRAELERRVSFPLHEWARFAEELRLLDVWRWDQYAANAMDGLMWSFEHASSGVTAHASGCNSYPPDGLAYDPTPEFVRMLLVAERLLGRELWPGFDVSAALDAIPDERDRVEHRLLQGLRAWAAAFELDGGDPQNLIETAFEQALVAHLSALGPARRQKNVKSILKGWPGVGHLDIELGGMIPPAWVELKWARRAGTLFNCLWDAGKLAQALRERQARYGYLVAGAPVAEWVKATPYRGLFDVSCHTDKRLVTDHLKEWTGWWEENQRTFPLQLPKPVMAVPVGRVTLISATGEAWEIRVARVEAPGTGTYLPRDLV